MVETKLTTPKREFIFRLRWYVNTNIVYCNIQMVDATRILILFWYSVAFYLCFISSSPSYLENILKIRQKICYKLFALKCCEAIFA
jgi:hypothetical protein